MLVSIKEALARLNNAVSQSLLYKLASSGMIRTVRMGRRVLVDTDSLDALKNGQLRQEEAKPPWSQGKPRDRGGYAAYHQQFTR